VSTLVDELAARYAQAADPAKAAPMAAYMKHHFVFFGLPSPVRRAIDRSVRAPGQLAEAEVLALAAECWERPEREFQYFACDELIRHAKRLSVGALADIEALVVAKSWWDTVDALAHCAGTMVLRHPELRVEMDRWLRSEDMWLRRVAILHQLGAKTATDADWLFAACLERAGEKEFFIRKAIGWALREYSKTDARAVTRFVAEHHEALSTLSQREAMKWLQRRAAAAAG
jgi:3-methyladenine DNA glycosylase AlkD